MVQEYGCYHPALRQKTEALLTKANKGKTSKNRTKLNMDGVKAELGATKPPTKSVLGAAKPNPKATPKASILATAASPSGVVKKESTAKPSPLATVPQLTKMDRDMFIGAAGLVSLTNNIFYNLHLTMKLLVEANDYNQVSAEFAQDIALKNYEEGLREYQKMVLGNPLANRPHLIL